MSPDAQKTFRKELARYRRRHPRGMPKLHRPYTRPSNYTQDLSEADLRDGVRTPEWHKKQTDAPAWTAEDHMRRHRFTPEERRAAIAGVAAVRAYLDWYAANAGDHKEYEGPDAFGVVDGKLPGHPPRRKGLVLSAVIMLAREAGLDLGGKATASDYRTEAA